MKDQIIQLDTTDTLDSARDRIKWVRAEHVLLVFPDDPRQPILQRPLDLIVLQRIVSQRDSRLTLITTDSVIQQNAREVSLPYFSSLDSYYKKHLRRQPLPVVQTSAPLTEVVTDEINSPPADDQSSSPVGNEHLPNTRSVSGLLLVPLIGIVAGFVFLPSATVIYSVEGQSLTAEVDVTAQLAPSDSPTNITARIAPIDVSGSMETEVMGTESVIGEIASGVVRLQNLTDEQVRVPVGTSVESAALGLSFILEESVTLSGTAGEAVDVAVEAAQGGDDYNVDAGAIDTVVGPLAEFVIVTNPAPISGGTSDMVASVSLADRSRLAAELEDVLLQQAIDGFTEGNQVPLLDTEFVVEDSIEVTGVLSETYTAEVGEQRDVLGLDMTLRVSALVVDERPARELAYRALIAQVEQERVLDPASVDFTRLNEVPLRGVDGLDFTLRADGQLVLPTVPTSLNRQIAGRSSETAQVIVQQQLDLSVSPSIAVNPGFMPVLPILPSRITIEEAGSDG